MGQGQSEREREGGERQNKCERMASWQMRLIKTMHGKQKPNKKQKTKTNKKLSIFSFFCVPQINECSTETGVEGET